MHHRELPRPARLATGAEPIRRGLGLQTRLFCERLHLWHTPATKPNYLSIVTLLQIR